MSTRGKVAELKQDFQRAVTAHFVGLTPMLDDALKVFVAAPHPGAQFFLLEYDSARFADEFAACVWPMTPLGAPSMARHDLLKHQAVGVPAAIYDDDKYEAIGPWHQASLLFESWLGGRWNQVATAGLPWAVIGHHDSYFKTDVSTGARTNWDQVLARAASTSR